MKTRLLPAILTCLLIGLCGRESGAQLVPYSEPKPQVNTQVLLVEATDWVGNKTYEIITQDEFDKLSSEIRDEAALCREALKLAAEEWDARKDEKRRFPANDFDARKAVVLGKFPDRTKAMTARLEYSEKEQKRQAGQKTGRPDRDVLITQACNLFQAKMADLLYRRQKANQPDRTVVRIPPVSGATRTDDGLVFRVRGGILKLQVCAENVIRVLYGPGTSVPVRTQSILAPKWTMPAWQADSGPESATLSTSKLQARLMLGTGALQFHDASGKLLFSEAPGGRGIFPTNIWNASALSARLDFLVGTDETMYGVDAGSTAAEPLAGLIPILVKNTLNVNPILVSTRGYALLWDNPGPMSMDAGIIEETGSGAKIPGNSMFDTSGRQGGLTAEYFVDSKLLDKKLSRFEPWDSNYNWAFGSPAPGIAPDGWSARWTGSFATGPAGSYEFSLRGDDGARLWLNEVLLVDAWQAGGQWKSAQTNLPACSMIPIRMEFYDVQQQASMSLLCEVPALGASTIAWQADSADALDYYFVYGPTTSEAVLGCFAAISKPAPKPEPVPEPAPEPVQPVEPAPQPAVAEPPPLSAPPPAETNPPPAPRPKLDVPLL